MRLCLTLGVDVQKDRIEGPAVLLGPRNGRQLVDRAIFWGDPTTAESDKGQPVACAHQYRRTPVLRQRRRVPLRRTMVDSSDGHSTGRLRLLPRAPGRERARDQGIEHLRKADPRAAERPDDQLARAEGQKGVKLWTLGSTPRGRDLRPARVQTPGPGYVHLSSRLPDDEFDQITAERLVTPSSRRPPRLSGRCRQNATQRRPRLRRLRARRGSLGQVDRWKDGDWERGKPAAGRPSEDRDEGRREAIPPRRRRADDAHLDRRHGPIRGRDARR